MSHQVSRVNCVLGEIEMCGGEASSSSDDDIWTSTGYEICIQNGSASTASPRSSRRDVDKEASGEIDGAERCSGSGCDSGLDAGGGREDGSLWDALSFSLALAFPLIRLASSSALERVVRVFVVVFCPTLRAPGILS